MRRKSKHSSRRPLWKTPRVRFVLSLERREEHIRKMRPEQVKFLVKVKVKLREVSQQTFPSIGEIGTMRRTVGEYLRDH